MRNQLLIDSKACQLEQIKDREKRMQQIRDIDDAWNEVLYRDFIDKTEKERSKIDQRRQSGRAVQDYLKSQMYEKMHADSQKLHEEINLELEQISIQNKEEAKQEEERLKKKEKTRKTLKEEISMQIHKKNELREKQRKNEIDLEKFLNKKIENEMIKEENAKKSERVGFI